MFNKLSSASRLLSFVTALAVIAILWPSAVSAGWFKKMFHKECRTPYDPVQISPHCQQYYGYFPTCWRVFPQDFQNCPPGDYCPGTGTTTQPSYNGVPPMPADVPMPEPIDPDEVPTDTGDVPPADVPPPVPPAVPYEEPSDAPTDVNPVPDLESPALDTPAEPQPEEAIPLPEGDEESSSSLFLPPISRRETEAASTSNWQSHPEEEQRFAPPRQRRMQAAQPSRDINRRNDPLIQLGTIEPRNAAAQDRRAVETPVLPAALPIPADAAGEVAILLEALSDPDTPGRHELAYRLGMMKESATPAVPALTVLLQDPDAHPWIERRCGARPVVGRGRLGRDRSSGRRGGAYARHDIGDR